MREKLEVIRQYFDERILITNQKKQSRLVAVFRRPRTAYAQSGRTPHKTLLNIVSQQPHKKSPRRASQNSYRYVDTRTGTPKKLSRLIKAAREAGCMTLDQIVRAQGEADGDVHGRFVMQALRERLSVFGKKGGRLP